MVRCFLAELFSFGGGHALTGGLTRAAGWTALAVVSTVLFLWTPWAVYLLLAGRLVSIIDATRRGRRGPAGGRWHWKPMIAFVVVSFGFVLAFRTFGAETFKSPSASMSPTLRSGDFFIADKLSIQWRAPARGEIVVYRVGPMDFIGRIVAVGGDDVAFRGGVLHLNGAPVPQRATAEVEFAVDGETGGYEVIKGPAAIEELGGHRYRVMVDEHAKSEWGDYPREETGCARSVDGGAHPGVELEPGKTPGSCHVPAGTVFILGDNRGNSFDSRVRGALPVSTVRARVVGIWGSKHGGWFSRIGAIE